MGNLRYTRYGQFKIHKSGRVLGLSRSSTWNDECTLSLRAADEG